MKTVTNNPIMEMIAAFAAGCMDKENFIQFKDYLSEGGELPQEELGELQNIVAMIPIILDLETPDPSIKNNVAKKLMGMKDEIKTKIIEERHKTFSTNITKTTPFSAKLTKLGETKHGDKEERQTASIRYPDTFHTSKKIEVPKEITNTVVQDLRKPESKIETPPQIFQSRTTEFFKKQETKSSSGLIGWLALLLTIIFFGMSGYLTYNSVTSLNNKIEELDNRISSFKSELATSTNFVNNYVTLIELFNYKDIMVINLNPAVPGENSSARVFLAYNEKEGLVQFKNLKTLMPNQGYQLWLVSKGQSYSMGVFTPNGNEYLRITSFPYIPKDQIQYLKVTIESNTGSPTPSIQNVLSGEFK